ncbi:hypothetical protein CAI21_17810 [Alkalilimnicola ehrlichii]|uniref:YfaZ family protein n=1 Tax=Alkalilimnicola ehrlichii TaxID=351052 RepID=A0A3E0WFI8_9GAMM|nr:YfaZ family outer membrane protein [Alkalilimnicola ehrlichii]RFA26183.1 hypothetical protein CAI21_17810 [Alkalilimnicola ehrlichii]RFA31702.1 hypothetical protein CAL65_21710 [Alkalilimnicola ehrlichii]
MRRVLYVALAALGLAPSAYASSSIDLKLNDNMAEVTYATAADGLGFQDGDVGVGLLFNDDSDIAAHASLQSFGRMDDYVSFAVGLKGYAIRVDEPSENVASFAIGGGVGYTIPNTPVTASLSGFIAPNILTFGDASRVREWSARVQAQLLPNAAVFVGWRELSLRLDEGGTYKLDDEFHVGLRLGF